MGYKSLITRLFSRDNSPENSTPTSPGPYFDSRPTPPSRALSVPSLPLSKNNSTKAVRRPTLLVRRPHSTNLDNSTTPPSRGSFLWPRSRRNSFNTINATNTKGTASTSRAAAFFAASSVSASLSEQDLVLSRPTIPFQQFPHPSALSSPSSSQGPAALTASPRPDPLQEEELESDQQQPLQPEEDLPPVRESCDIDLLLSPQPADAKKAIIKRLEGLALALDMHLADVTSSEKAKGKKPTTIRFSSAVADIAVPEQIVPSESLSPMATWGDEYGEDPDFIHEHAPFAFYDDVSTYSHSHQSSPCSASSASTSSSLCLSMDCGGGKSITETAPSSQSHSHSGFQLEPIPQLTLNICKSTPPPSTCACEQQGVIPVALSAHCDVGSWHGSETGHADEPPPL